MGVGTKSKTNKASQWTNYLARQRVPQSTREPPGMTAVYFTDWGMEAKYRIGKILYTRTTHTC